MTTEQQIIKQSELLNRLVIDRNTAEQVGRIEKLWLDPNSHQVLGFVCKSGFMGGNKQAFTWAQIGSIGKDSVMVNASPEGQEPTQPEQVANIIGYQLMAETGNKLGKIVDYILAVKTGEAIGYLFASSGWSGMVDGTYLLAPEDITRFGSKLAIVIDAAIQEPQQYTEGMSQKVNQAAEFFQEDYDKTMGDLKSLIRGGQNLTEQAKEKATEVAAQAKEGAHNLAEQAGQVTESALTLAEQAKDKATQVAGQAQEKIVTPKRVEKPFAFEESDTDGDE